MSEVVLGVMKERDESIKKFADIRDSFIVHHAMVEEVVQQNNRLKADLPNVLRAKRKRIENEFDLVSYKQLKDITKQLNSHSSNGAKAMGAITEYTIFLMELEQLEKELKLDLEILTPQYDAALQSLKHNASRVKKEKNKGKLGKEIEKIEQCKATSKQLLNKLK